jgi:hypothetical protein
MQDLKLCLQVASTGPGKGSSVSLFGNKRFRNPKHETGYPLSLYVKATIRQIQSVGGFYEGSFKSAVNRCEIAEFNFGTQFVHRDMSIPRATNPFAS